MLNSDLTYPNLPIDSKLGFLSIGLRLYFHVFHKEILEFSNVALAGLLSVFPNSGKKDGKFFVFKHKPKLYFQIVTPWYAHVRKWE